MEENKCEHKYVCANVSEERRIFEEDQYGFGIHGSCVWTHYKTATLFCEKCGKTIQKAIDVRYVRH